MEQPNKEQAGVEETEEVQLDTGAEEEEEEDQREKGKEKNSAVQQDEEGGGEEEGEEEVPTTADVGVKHEAASGGDGTEKGVRFQLVSDLHLEFKGTLEKMPPIPVRSPILALLGDIGYPSKENYRQFLLDQADRFEHVLVVAGNHEYYNQESVQKANRRIEEICSERNNLHFLNKSQFRVGDVIFLGCTLWPHIPPESIEKVWQRVNDYRRIRSEGKSVLDPTTVLKQKGVMAYLSEVYSSLMGERTKANSMEQKEEGEKEATFTITPHDTNAWHEDQVDWLVSEIERIKQQNEANKLKGGEQLKVVVLTHHAPSKWRCIAPSEKEFEAINYDDLEWMMEEPVAVWGFGHTHWSCDHVINSTRVVSNQCGYIVTSPDGKGSNHYDPGLVINVDASIEMAQSMPTTEGSGCLLM